MEILYLVAAYALGAVTVVWAYRLRGAREAKLLKRARDSQIPRFQVTIDGRSYLSTNDLRKAKRYRDGKIAAGLFPHLWVDGKDRG